MQYTIGITVNLAENTDPASVSSELISRVTTAVSSIDGVTNVSVTEVVTEE